MNKFFNQDLNAEATNVMPVMDMFWGERYGQLRDSFWTRLVNSNK